MKAEKDALKNITICRSEDEVVFVTRQDFPIDSIVTGCLVNLLAFPLLCASFAVGVWLTALAVTDGRYLVLIPMGLLFMLGPAAPLYLLLWSQPALFPYECRFRKRASGGWCLQRRLWFLRSRWRELDAFSIVSRPAHSRGDWGYDLIVRTGRSNIMLTPPGAFTSSRAEARRAAEHDSKVVAACLGVQCRLEKW